MARTEAKYGVGTLLLIDGFAGPGRYEDGEPGSPLIMLDALFSHADRDNILKAKFAFLFIENDKARVEHLREEVAGLETHPNVQIDIVEGSFDEVMESALDAIPKSHRLIPAFAFIMATSHAHASLASGSGRAVVPGPSQPPSPHGWSGRRPSTSLGGRPDSGRDRLDLTHRQSAPFVP